ncbi:MAG: GNAT family N-acetyltransferase [Actinomycetota bacterium]|nr:GNAT family N-acetyltransferase [Actinomycetota bacterium]
MALVEQTAPPAPAAERVVLGPGIEVLVRPIRPEDKPLLSRGFDRLSPEARFQRFFTPLTELAPSDLRYLTEVDHHDHEALVAIDPEEGELVAVARYIRTERREESEVAIVVADEWRGQGLGTAILKRLAAHARRAGIRHFIAITLSGNSPANELFENFIPDHARTRHGDPGQNRIWISLPRSQQFAGTSLARALRSAARGTVRLVPGRRPRKKT